MQGSQQENIKMFHGQGTCLVQLWVQRMEHRAWHTVDGNKFHWKNEFMKSLSRSHLSHIAKIYINVRSQNSWQDLSL